jgi:hypothetical protein
MLQWLMRLVRGIPWLGGDPYESLIHELDTDMFDDASAKAAGSLAPAMKEQYTETKPFDADAWAARPRLEADRSQEG